MKANPLVYIYDFAREIFNLHKDSDETGTTENIRKNVDFHGANAWTLVFAIFIASIGLNMNSAAVIIGAMLISPLMGPILGIGLALGINDEPLLRKSFRNLSIAVLISVGTSMVYFWLSPIHEAQSELLARTYPTFYDVLIAFFGGAAGIVSISRSERGPSVAGVAIATALMPPLCTAGFALSSGNFKFLAGAIYLFLINSVFIALSTFLFVRYMKFQIVQYQDHGYRIKLRRWISAIVAAIILPSLFFAWTLLQESRFKMRADKFLEREMHFKTAFVVNKEVKYGLKKSSIEIDLVGTPLSPAEIQELSNKLPLYDLNDTSLDVRQIHPNEAPQRTASYAEVELARLQQAEVENNAQTQLLVQVTEEANLVFPGVNQVTRIGDTLGVIWKKAPKKAQILKMNEYLGLRDREMKNPPIHLTEIR